MARPGPFVTSTRAGPGSSTRRRTRPPRRPRRSRPALAARLVACWHEPHWLSTVVAAAVNGRPAVSHAVRAMLNDCSPTWLTQPPTTWPTAPDRCRRARRPRAGPRRAGRPGAWWPARRCAARSGCGRLRRSRPRSWADCTAGLAAGPATHAAVDWAHGAARRAASCRARRASATPWRPSSRVCSSSRQSTAAASRRTICRAMPGIISRGCDGYARAGRSRCPLRHSHGGMDVTSSRGARSMDTHATTPGTGERKAGVAVATDR